MYDFLWHGRGGQGSFTAARLLGSAYSLNNQEHYALAFPSFGPERRGAPIRAFTKLDTKKIENRALISKADYLLFTDDTLFNDKAFDELKDGGKILLCTKQIIADKRIITIDGVSLALKYLGLPITNTVLLGALAAVFTDISIDDLNHAIENTLPPKLQEKNKALILEAYKRVLEA